MKIERTILILTKYMITYRVLRNYLTLSFDIKVEIGGRSHFLCTILDEKNVITGVAHTRISTGLVQIVFVLFLTCAVTNFQVSGYFLV